jgi:hypothetical protein
MKPLSESYSIEAWCDDFHNLNELAAGTQDHQQLRDSYYSHFHLIYSEESWVDLAFERIVAAYLWMMKNRNELDAGDALVLGASGGIASVSLIEALYRCFVNNDAKTIYKKVTVKQILTATTEQKKTNS